MLSSLVAYLLQYYQTTRIQKKIQILGDISKLYKALSVNKGQPCGRFKTEVAYYDVLLNQIDEEIKGVVTGDNELVRFLVTRLAHDLKKMPKMKHLFKLTQEQQHLKLLEILRQKLVVRCVELSKYTSE